MRNTVWILDSECAQLLGVRFLVAQRLGRSPHGELVCVAKPYCKNLTTFEVYAQVVYLTKESA